MSDRKPRADEVAARAAREHGAIVTALHMLEKALASPAPGREASWKRRAGAALVVVVDSLNVHCESAEQRGGVLAEAEVALGRPPELRQARSQHEQMLRDARQLLTALEERADDTKLTYREVRQCGWRLSSALYRHQALEADLIMEAFERDIGGEG